MHEFDPYAYIADYRRRRVRNDNIKAVALAVVLVVGLVAISCIGTALLTGGW